MSQRYLPSMILLAAVWGATILGEPLRGSALGGLLILLGVALGSGVVALRRRAQLRTAP